MKTGENIFRFLARMILDKFYGTVTIRLENGKVTHVETETRRMWQYKDLPDPALAREGGEPAHGERR